MEYLIEYGLFLAKAATIVVVIAAVVGILVSAGRGQKRADKKGTIKVTRLNEHFDEMWDALRSSVLNKEQLKLIARDEKKKSKAERKQEKEQAKKAAGPESEVAEKKRVYVLNFKGDIAAHQVKSLREEITTILSLARAADEVVLRLESPGGMVHAYGLASSQLLRIKNAGIPLIICVDKVAASGGYMMACLADRLIAAPFAIIGSIGVLVQLPNFHRVLKKHDVDFEMISAGEYKRTLTTFGEITQKDRDKVKEDVETIHDIFKQWVKEYRPSVDIDKIATGETWLGTQAKERYMVDDIRTSDEYILKACEDADAFEVQYELKKSIQDRLGKVLDASLDRALANWLNKPVNTDYQ